MSEISELGGKFEIIDNELGLTLVSERTGLHSKWTIQEIIRDDEGDITHWILWPADASLVEHQLHGWRMTIFND